MGRRLALIALLAGVAVVGSTVVDARPRVAETESRSKSKSKKAKKKAKTSKKTRAKAKQAKSTKTKKTSKAKHAAKRVSKRGKGKRKREKKVPRIPDRTTDYARNMPDGFAWPPTAAMKATSKICEQQLDELGVDWEPAKPEGRIVAPVVVPGMALGGITYTSAYRRAPHPLDCQFARTLATLGGELHALGVREVKFGSIYRNTTVRVGGKSKNILSRHALGIAMDVVSITDQSGRVAVVKDDYPKDDPLLLGVEEAINRSGKFRTVLTPRNDPASHHDHFHIEAVVDYDAADRP